jgi:hypothetical protein
MALSTSSKKIDHLIEECFGSFLKEGTLQHLEKEPIEDKIKNGLLIIKHFPLADRSTENEESYINEQYEKFDGMYGISLSKYKYKLFVIIFCSFETFNEIIKKSSLENANVGIGELMVAWAHNSRRDKEFIESFKEFIYPVSIKPAKRS